MAVPATKCFAALWLVVLFVTKVELRSCHRHGSCDHPVVGLVYPEGSIRGHVLESAQGKDYYAFQDVPYAAPPVGSLRFKSPSAHPGWDGILNTTANRKVCLQAGATDLEQSEDCLFVNVYTPVCPGSNRSLAVYVWIHGGGYAVWDASFDRFGPQYLIDYDIVIVTLNYRLWALGFLTTEDDVIPGNLGLRDQSFALDWVQQNIHLFGGDPQRVTIGGESAGASAVSFQLLSEKSRGKFRAAIQESGSAINTWSYIANARIYAVQVAKLLNSSINTDDSNQILEVLQKADATDLLTATFQVNNVEPGPFLVSDLWFSPTCESSNTSDPFVSEPMHQAFMNGDFAKVPTLIGINSEEMIYFLPSSSTTLPFKVINWTVYYEKAAALDANPSQLIHSDFGLSASDKLAAETAIKTFYTNTTFSDDQGYPYLKVSSDFYFGHATLRQAELTSKYVPVFLYVFDYQAVKESPFPGTQHTEDVLYLWKNANDKDVNEFQSLLRHQMCLLWSNFIKHGDPTPHPDEVLQNLTWPRVTPDSVTYVQLGESFEISTNPRHYYEVKDILLPYLKDPIHKLAVF